jgi:branched-chain amino acid transport system permease protein
VNVNTLIFVAVVCLGLLIARRSAADKAGKVSLGALALLLLVAPQISDNLSVLIPVFIGLLLGAGWNIIGGYTGYASFGQVAFFGIGAYAMAATIANRGGFLGLPPAVGFLMAGAVCAVYAFVVGLPVLRLRGHYFAITTLTLAAATQQVVKALGFLGGSAGINTPIVRHVYGLTRDEFFYYLSLGLAAAAIGLTWLISRSKFGFGLQAIRENEEAAASMGIDTTLYKLRAFIIAAIITGIAGAIQAYFRSGVSPEDDGVFQVRFNLLPLIIALIGGTGTVWGPLIGAFTFLGIEHALISASGSSSLIQNWERVITGTVIVLVVLFLPRGLSQLVTTRRRGGWRMFIDNLRAYRV